jgi:prolyl 4-hydroxylase
MNTELKSDYPGAQQINDEPPVYLFENFLSAAECEHLVELSRPHMQRAVVSGGDEGVESEGRTGGVHWIAHGHDAISTGFSSRVAALVGLPLVNAESIQVINYGAGQEYRPHFDAWVADTEAGARCLARGGQRLITCLLYLSEVDAGGGTFFPKMDVEVMPRLGRMVLFHNCYGNSSRRHPASLHGGMPPESGVKWACNFWFRESAYQQQQRDPMKPSATTRRF